MKVSVYTRELERLYPFGLAKAVHFAAEMNGEKTPLNRNYGILFAKGEIAPRVVASCSIPVIFQPICINGVHYVDGGAFQNLPVSAIRQKCDKVIALNLYHLDEGKYKDNLISVAYRAFVMMMVSNVAADSSQADLFIDLDTNGCLAYDISKIEELFFRGYESTVRALEENSYQRVLPKEIIKFSKKKRKKDLWMPNVQMFIS